MHYKRPDDKASYRLVNIGPSEVYILRWIYEILVWGVQPSGRVLDQLVAKDTGYACVLHIPLMYGEWNGNSKLSHDFQANRIPLGKNLRKR